MSRANLNHYLALVLLAQNAQYLGFAESAFFHEQSKIEGLKSYYFSSFNWPTLGKSLHEDIKFLPPFRWFGFSYVFLFY